MSATCTKMVVVKASDAALTTSFVSCNEKSKLSRAVIRTVSSNSTITIQENCPQKESLLLLVLDEKQNDLHHVRSQLCAILK